MAWTKEEKGVFAAVFTAAFVMCVTLISACNSAPSRSREVDTLIQTLHILTDRLTVIEEKLNITVDPKNVITFEGAVRQSK